MTNNFLCACNASSKTLFNELFTKNNMKTMK